MRQKILSGSLNFGTTLPATRKLAIELGIGRNTVDKAYQQLTAEGYVTSKVGSGFAVNKIPIEFTAYNQIAFNIHALEKHATKRFLCFQLR